MKLYGQWAAAVVHLIRNTNTNNYAFYICRLDFSGVQRQYRMNEWTKKEHLFLLVDRLKSCFFFFFFFCCVFFFFSVVSSELTCAAFVTNDGWHLAIVEFKFHHLVFFWAYFEIHSISSHYLESHIPSLRRFFFFFFSLRRSVIVVDQLS